MARRHKFGRVLLTKTDSDTLLMGFKSEKFAQKSQYILGYQRRISSSFLVDFRKNTSELESYIGGISYRPKKCNEEK